VLAGLRASLRFGSFVYDFSEAEQAAPQRAPPRRRFPLFAFPSISSISIIVISISSSSISSSRRSSSSIIIPVPRFRLESRCPGRRRVVVRVAARGGGDLGGGDLGGGATARPLFVEKKTTLRSTLEHPKSRLWLVAGCPTHDKSARPRSWDHPEQIPRSEHPRATAVRGALAEPTKKL
jgi:hypothetical protein